MRAFACKLLGGGPAKVVFLGGSITAGRGAGNEAELSYVPRFARYLNATFPASTIEFVNRGEPASSSGFAAPCVDALVGSSADLVVLEYTANDNEFVGLNSLERRAYEHLLRRLLSLDSRPAVVLLHAYQWWRAAGGGMTSGFFYKEPEQQLTTLSHYYDVPSLSMRAAAWRSWWDGVDGFKVDKVLKEGQHAPFEPNKSIAQAPAGEEAQYFYNDVGHPSAQGHAALAELLAALVQRSAAEAAAGLSPTARQYAQLLPPPMQPAIQEGERDACIIHDGFKAAMAAKQGFQYVAEVPDAATRDAQKWGWVARSVGEQAEMGMVGSKQVEGSQGVVYLAAAAAAACKLQCCAHCSTCCHMLTSPVPAGDWIEFQVDTSSSNATGNTTLGNTTLGTTTGNTALHLSFLRGWMVNYGDALVSCTSGCACDDTPFSCLSEFMFTMYVLQPVQVTRHPQCRIRVTVVDAPRAQPPTEHKVHLNALFVTSY
ncbi:hypothetical protein COHA_000177 [Chlorella ohadii]|uniref:SGNH hydrolase-type esterase domain-containing protein n=1 Tax=Chlorella ohadii TaxID=2649997 RepID=A0AAD5DYH4_9CHLO|nr:hypothetical protein COHA_000177 [Chlorella ohadii]